AASTPEHTVVATSSHACHRVSCLHPVRNLRGLPVTSACTGEGSSGKPGNGGRERYRNRIDSAVGFAACAPCIGCCGGHRTSADFVDCDPPLYDTHRQRVPTSHEWLVGFCTCGSNQLLRYFGRSRSRQLPRSWCGYSPGGR